MSELISRCCLNYGKTISISVKQFTTPKKTTTHFQNKPNDFAFNQSLGFSLIEIMIVISILSILLSAVIPSVNSIINQSRLSKTSSELIGSLSLARQYAIMSGNKAHICALTSIEPILCQEERDFNANWSQGWMVFADINDNNEYDLDDTVLSVSPNSKTINVVFNQRGRLRFFPNGSARSAGFYICNKNSQKNRHIKLLYSGRARTTQISNPSQLTTCLSAN